MTEKKKTKKAHDSNKIDKNQNQKHDGSLFEASGKGIFGISDLLNKSKSKDVKFDNKKNQNILNKGQQLDPIGLLNAVTSLASTFFPEDKSGKMKPDDDFFNLGASSVQAVELASKLSKNFGIDLTLDDLFADARPRKIVEKWLKKKGINIDHLFQDDTGSDKTSEQKFSIDVKSHRLDELDEELQKIQKEDIKLIQKDIQLADSLPWVEEPEMVQPGNILLTGTTGFLGSHVLFDLLRHSDAHVTCLVRAKDDKLAEERLAHELGKRDFLWSNELKKRITVIAGDLQKEKLGWDDKTWEYQSKKIDSIVNVAAAVDFVRGYNSLREMNVHGVMTLAEFAVTNRIKPLHQISSLAVFDELGIPAIGEEEPPARIERLFSGYDKTKWASEAMLRRAREHGLCVTFLRPGGINGNTETGVYNQFDLSSGLIAAFQSLRIMPEFRYLNVAPVNWISRMISEIVIDPESWGYNYHLIGEPVALRQQIREMTISGMAVRVMHFEDWRQYFLDKMEKDPIPHLEFLALALKNKATVKLMEAVMNWPAATAHRVDELIKRRNLPKRPKNDSLSQVKTLERLVRDERSTLPGRNDIPYLFFRETVKGTLSDIYEEKPEDYMADFYSFDEKDEEKEMNCTFKFKLSVASFYQLFQERRIDVHGLIFCDRIHSEPLKVLTGNLFVRPDDGVPLSHGFVHPLMKYKLTLETADNEKWWMEGLKTASPGFNFTTQARTMQVVLGREGGGASFKGEMVVPNETYIEEQIKGIKVNPDVTQEEHNTAKLIWIGWFFGQIARGFMDPILRVGGGMLDKMRTMKDKGE